MCSLYLGDQIISGQATLVGESRNIGQIIPSAIPLTDAGLHLLDGSLILGSGIYSDFVDYIASIYDAAANYFCTEAEWQTAVTTYGVCGKFVYDSVNNTVRLPKYNSKIYTGGGTAPVIGNGMTLGITDGTTNNGLYYSAGNGINPISGVYGTNVGTMYSGSASITNGKSVGVTTDPTKSGIIAQISNITTSLDGYYYIVIATSTKTDIQVDIDEIATDLNGKADVDLSNCTKPHIVETYVNGTSWYRVYSDGWCEQGGTITSLNSSYTGGTVNLLKKYSSSDYLVLLNKLVNTDYATATYTSKCTSQTLNSFTYTVHITTNNSKVYWQASGYIN